MSKQEERREGVCMFEWTDAQLEKKKCLFLIAAGAAAQAQRCIITYLTELHNHRHCLINAPYLRLEYK